MKKATFAKFPKRLRIGAYDMSVVIMENQFDDGGQSYLWGDFDSNAMCIRVASKLPSGVVPDGVTAVATFLHEVLHAVWFSSSLRTGDDEERQVDTVSNALTQILRDNPAVLPWIAANLKGRA